MPAYNIWLSTDPFHSCLFVSIDMKSDHQKCLNSNILQLYEMTPGIHQLTVPTIQPSRKPVYTCPRHPSHKLLNYRVLNWNNNFLGNREYFDRMYKSGRINDTKCLMITTTRACLVSQRLGQPM